MQTNRDLVDVGENIFLAGIILQFLSYLIFLSLAIRCHWLCSKQLNATRPTTPGETTLPSVNKLYLALYFSSVFIIVRCIFRTIESAQGFRGHLVSHESEYRWLISIPSL